MLDPKNKNQWDFKAIGKNGWVTGWCIFRKPAVFSCLIQFDLGQSILSHMKSGFISRFRSWLRHSTRAVTCSLGNEFETTRILDEFGILIAKNVERPSAWPDWQIDLTGVSFSLELIQGISSRPQRHWGTWFPLLGVNLDLQWMCMVGVPPFRRTRTYESCHYLLNLTVTEVVNRLNRLQ